MKKYFLIAISILFFSTRAYAFNFGVDTYAQDGGTLILNSLGDQVNNSTFGTLGSNDFISENAVKNELKLNGYTYAGDYNPQNTLGQFTDDYNVALPTSQPLTKLTFAGFEGDPRKTQDVYVLTSEYNRLSSQGQATSIDNINTVNNTQTTNINTLNSQVSNINTVNDRQDQQIASTNQRVDQVSDRVTQLERTQTIVGGEVRLYDSRKLQIRAFVDYTTTRSTVDRVGIIFQYKLGKSAEEKEIDTLNARLDKLEGIKNQKENESNSQVYYTNNGLGIRNKF